MAWARNSHRASNANVRVTTKSRFIGDFSGANGCVSQTEESYHEGTQRMVDGLKHASLNKSVSLDVGFYLRFYPDVIASTLEEAEKHYNEIGSAQGRFPSSEAMLEALRAESEPLPRDFSPRQYLAANPHLSYLTEEWQAELHYILEGRVLNLPTQTIETKRTLARSGFDVVFYKQYYDDIKELSDFQARTHYSQIGEAQGRFASLEALKQHYARETSDLPGDFTDTNYIKANPDLKRHLKRPWEPAYHFLKYGRYEGRKYKPDNIVYDKEYLHMKLLNAFNPIEIVVDGRRNSTINVLVPAFDFASISAGFFGVFQFALFVKRCGFSVRLVLFDRFEFDAEAMRMNLKNYPGLGIYCLSLNTFTSEIDPRRSGSVRMTTA